MPSRKQIYIDEIRKELKNNNLDYDRTNLEKFLNYLQNDTLKIIHKDLKFNKGNSKFKDGE